MSFFSWFTNWRENRRISKARSGTYGRIVAWVEARYGNINKTDYSIEVLNKFQQALDYGRLDKGDKLVVGLKKYIEKERYKDLLRNQ
ncbi:MAG: hypothetical protein ACFFAU_05120 [Candidatus Hodarchaeota archaeon]